MNKILKYLFLVAIFFAFTTIANTQTDDEIEIMIKKLDISTKKSKFLVAIEQSSTTGHIEFIDCMERNKSDIVLRLFGCVTCSDSLNRHLRIMINTLNDYITYIEKIDTLPANLLNSDLNAYENSLNIEDAKLLRLLAIDLQSNSNPDTKNFYNDYIAYDDFYALHFRKWKK